MGGGGAVMTGSGGNQTGSMVRPQSRLEVVSPVFASSIQLEDLAHCLRKSTHSCDMSICHVEVLTERMVT